MTDPQPEVSPQFWAERLSLLLGTLSTELHASEPGTIVARQLRSGFTVSLTQGDDGLRRCRISSQERPGNPAAWDRFHSGVESIAQHVGVSRWRTVAPESGYRGAVVEFQEKGVTS